MINIPKPPTRKGKTESEYLKELEAWTRKIYDALRHIAENGGNSK